MASHPSGGSFRGAVAGLPNWARASDRQPIRSQLYARAWPSSLATPVARLTRTHVGRLAHARARADWSRRELREQVGIAEVGRAKWRGCCGPTPVQSQPAGRVTHGAKERGWRLKSRGCYICFIKSRVEWARIGRKLLWVSSLPGVGRARRILHISGIERRCRKDCAPMSS